MTLSMLGIEKSFDQNHVLKKVDFVLKPGEIRALMGENGAGKSTFMKIVMQMSRQESRSSAGPDHVTLQALITWLIKSR